MGVARYENEYVFSVSLKGSRGISRMIALRGDQSLDSLHEAIFAAFDRFDEHLYSFYFPNAPRRNGAAGRKHIEYTAPQAFEGPDSREDEGPLDASATKLDDLGLKPGQKFEYLFDFGDSWWHTGTLEAINPVVPRAKYPQIRERHGESPPQYADADE